MDTARRRRIDDLFGDALELDPLERAEFLAGECAGDAELRAEVEAMFAAHERSGLLDGPVADVAAGLIEKTPERIGPYRLLHRLGQGGMAIVHLAERDDGHFRRRVAIKLVRTGFRDMDVYRRFLGERHILASLDHPNVARLLDGGAVDGTPYLVMEFVDGLPITEYCDRNRVDIEGRLRLFLDMCEAVRFAHHNLIVHRDLKPSNIFVSNTGAVKLLDFGIAKLLNPMLGPEAMPVTRTDLRAMTPEYASPEQVRGETVTTASDVYSLGIVLYELLTGHRAYQLERRSPDEVYRAVCEEDPERPSARVAATGAPVTPDDVRPPPTPESVAGARDSTPARLRRRLSGDLDAIVMMAIRKEPNRRYPSAGQLADDIRRHLDGVPVRANVVGRAYRIRKFVRRHRVESIAAFVVLLSLLGGAAAALWQASIAGEQRDRAENALVSAQVALDESTAVTDFMIRLFEAATPNETGGDSITARELLRRGVERVNQLNETPAVQARMLEAVGQVNVNLGDYASAEALLERSVALREGVTDGDPLDLAASLSALALIERRRGDYRRSVDLYRRALAIQTAHLAPASPVVASTKVYLASALIYLDSVGTAEVYNREAVAGLAGTPGDISPEAAEARIQLASLRRRLGDLNEAESLFRQALDIQRLVHGDQGPEVADAMFHVGDIVWERSQDRAGMVDLYSRALEYVSRAVGESDARYAGGLGRFASRLTEAGLLDQADSVFRKAIALQTRVLGPNHPGVAETLTSYGSLLRARGDLVGAEQYYLRGIDGMRRTLGPDHNALGAVLPGLAWVRMDRGDLDGAEQAMREALRVRILTAGPRAHVVGILTGELAYIRGRRGDYVEADSLIDRSLAILRRTLPEDHLDVRHAHELAASIYDLQGDTARAREHRALATPR